MATRTIVPLTLDMAIVVLSLRALRAARDGRYGLLLNFLVTTLIAATVSLNVAAVWGDWVAVILHTTPVGTALVCLQTTLSSARRRARRSNGTALPQLPPVRWLLRPNETRRLWAVMAIEGVDLAEARRVLVQRQSRTGEERARRGAERRAARGRRGGRAPRHAAGLDGARAAASDSGVVDAGPQRGALSSGGSSRVYGAKRQQFTNHVRELVGSGRTPGLWPPKNRSTVTSTTVA